MPGRMLKSSPRRPQPEASAAHRVFPILFSTTMVRALIDGQKTQTRRPAASELAKAMPGDRLWVHETWHVRFRDQEPDKPTRDYHDTPRDQRAERLAEDVHFYEQEMRKRCNRRFMPSRWIPSIHMYRWASRLTLIVEALRFCRLQEISAAEAIAGGTGVKEVPNPQARHQPSADEVAGAPPSQFGSHWDSLHRKPGHRLVDNPEVVSLTFSLHRGNIDHLFKKDQDDH